MGDLPSYVMDESLCPPKIHMLKVLTPGWLYLSLGI